MSRLRPILYSLCLMVGLVAHTGMVFAGDIKAGEKIYNGRACVGCHGIGGRSQIDNYPALAGKSATFIADELKKFRSQERDNPTMNAMAGSLGDKDIANIAAYLSAQ